MSWHDGLAIRARQMGRTAPEFKKGSQNKATAAGLYLVVAAAIWYFVSWSWALIPAALAVLSAFQSMSAIMIALRLEKMDRQS